MSDDRNFKLFCKELDEIVSVKSYSHEEEAKVYEEFRSFLKEIPSSFRAKSYKKRLVDCLLVDASSYYAVLSGEVDKSLQSDIINALYLTVIEAYPHFEFEFICNDINNSIALHHMRSLFVKHLEGIPPPYPEKERKKLSSFGDMVKLSRKLKRGIIGQDEACDKVVDAVKLIVAGIADFSSFFYIGPTGVGKTKLAKVLGANYSGNFFKVNCGEFASAHDYAKLIGAPPGYVGHTENSLLAEKASVSNAWILLFDEIEKASPKFYDFLLSLLDDGTCTDNMGNVLDFSQSIFIFTTNDGIQDNKLGDTRVGFEKETISYEECKDEILRSIKKTFSPEFLNRIDQFIFFNQLTEDQLKKVARLEMHHLPIKRTAALVNYVISNSNHKEYGARNIAKFIKNNIATKVADAILKKQLPLGESKYYTFKVEKDNLHISNIEEENNGLDEKKKRTKTS